jgi:peptide/nickel transport system permease protein
MSTVAETTLGKPIVSGRAKRLRGAWRAFRRSRVAMIGLALLVLNLVIAIFAPLLAPYDPIAIDPSDALAAPSSAHLFGTDEFGRDVLSRVLYGGRAAMLIALTATLLAVFGGTALGVGLGYLGGWTDDVGSRVLDAFLSIPPIIILLVVLTSLGTSPTVLVLAMAATFGPGSARVARAAALEVVTKEYVAAARMRGESRVSIMFREIGPNVRDVMFVEFAMRASWALLLISALSFLGFGVNPPTPDWGLMIAENRDSMSIAWWATTFPILALGSLVIGLNLASDGLAKALGIDLTRGAPA